MATFHCLFKCPSSLLCPFALQYSIIFAILLLFVVVTFRSQFDLYHLSFSSTDYTFNSSKISSFPLLVKNGVPAVFLRNLISIDANLFLPFFLSFQNSLPYKKRVLVGESQCIMYFYFWKFLDQIRLKSCIKFPVFEKILIVLLMIFFISIGNFTTEALKNHFLVLNICYPHWFYILLG